MSLLSPSEALTFHSFLSAVDRGNSLDADDLSPDLADTIQITQGRDALAKATKDLMAMGGLAFGSKHGGQGKAEDGMNGGGAGSSYWPAVAPDGVGSSSTSAPENLGRSYGDAGTSARTSYHGHALPQLNMTPASSSSAHYTLPPLNEHPSNSYEYSRGTLHSSASAPSVMRHSTSKRSLPPDNDTPGPSSSNTTKRARSSAVAPPKSRRQSSVGESTSGNSSGKAAASSSARPALLSPSQKRANHIQSEQKRRANIRRGYEALCATVPALREAIAQEEAAAAAEAETGPKGRKRRKKVDDDKLDGRAGPKSENIVLQKTIEYIQAILDERQTLLARLQIARDSLGEGHPALEIPPEARDERGIPFWEREWNGGRSNSAGDDDGDDDAGDEEGASEDDA